MLMMSNVVSASTCISLIQGPITFDVESCEQLDTQNLELSNDTRLESLKGLDAASKKKVVGAYMGQVIKGKVVSSRAYDKAFPKAKGALNGQRVEIYIFPKQKMQCEQLESKRISGQMQQVCCNGRLEAPCLLSTQYTFKNAKVVGDTKSRAGNQARLASIQSKTYKSGMQAFQSKKYKKAAKKLETARSKGEIDDAGKYALAVSYRKLDLCRRAIPVLKEVHDKWLSNKAWLDRHDVVRKSIFLLARCYAKEQDSGQSVLILNSYLLEPKKYKPEIKQSMRHPDFGWIHTTKDYKKYKKDARARLK